MKLDGSTLSLAEFCAGLEKPLVLEPSEKVIAKINTAHEAVMQHAQGEAPVYGLNTGLGGNLGYRLKPEEISDFQMQIIAGRAAGCGEPLPEVAGRGFLLARIISAATGYSGISVELFEYLIAVYKSGLSPVIPEYGSIGDSDLVQNAHAALTILGGGKLWKDGNKLDAKTALENAGLAIPELKPKEGLALVSHSGLTVTMSALALQETGQTLEMAKSAIVLSYEGYGANQQILAAETNTLRPAPGQTEAAKMFRDMLKGSEQNPRRIQEALSFRTVASVFGTTQNAYDQAASVWLDEMNGSSDSPAVLENGDMISNINFHSPALALALENLSLSLAALANGSVQRMQKMANPAFSDLPAYLSPIGKGSAGFIPSQKTASVLLAEIRHAANPVIFDPAPISDGVEDMASMTVQAAMKLSTQLKPMKLLLGLETLVACQAIDLRKPHSLSAHTAKLHYEIRKTIPMLVEDRAIGDDIHKSSEVLARMVKTAFLET